MAVHTRQDYEDVLTALGACVSTGVPVLLWGDPGSGKTSAVESAHGKPTPDGREWLVKTMIISHYEPSDFAGLPMLHNGRVIFAPPSWAQELATHDGPAIAFLDEFSTASPSLQAAALRPLTHNQVGDLQLPKTVSFVAAANPADVAAAGWELAPPTASRFVHLDWGLPLEVYSECLVSGDWPELPVGTIPDGYDARRDQQRALIAGFLRARGSQLSKIPDDPALRGRAFPTPHLGLRQPGVGLRPRDRSVRAGRLAARRWLRGRDGRSRVPHVRLPPGPPRPRGRARRKVLLHRPARRPHLRRAPVSACRRPAQHDRRPLDDRRRGLREGCQHRRRRPRGADRAGTCASGRAPERCPAACHHQGVRPCSGPLRAAAWGLMMKALADRLAAAKLWITSPGSIRTGADTPRDLPYLAHALYALITVPTDQVPTMRADEYWRLYVNQAWAIDTPVPEIGRELAHVVWHLLMEHAPRARGVGVDSTTADDWHKACDLTVHDALTPERCSPNSVTTSAQLSRAARRGKLDPGRSAEEYFAVLSRLPAGSDATSGIPVPNGSKSGRQDQADPSDGDDDTDPESGDDPVGGTGSAGQLNMQAVGAGPTSSQQASPGQGTSNSGPGVPGGGDTSSGSGGQYPGAGHPGNGDPGDDGSFGSHLGDCGSACDGIPRDTDLPPDADFGYVSKVQAEGIRKQVAIDYLHAQKARGDQPGDALRWAKHITQPEIAWEPLLARAVRRAVGWTSGRHNPTWTRPSRRQSSHPDVLQPGWRRPLPNIAMVIDTSGSVDDRLLGKAMGEVEGALAAMGIRGGNVTVLACDASVGAVTRVRKATDATLVGGGGTDMRIGIAAASAQRPRPDLIVVFTDGCTPWPQQAPPGSPVIAAMLGRKGETQPDTPIWATRVECTLRG